MNKKKDDGIEFITNQPINTIDNIPSSLSSVGVTSGLTVGGNNLYLNPNSQSITVTNNSAENNIIKTNPKEVAELKKAIIGMIIATSKSNDQKDKTAIRKIAESIGVYWQTLDNFINDGDITATVFNKLVNKLTNVVITADHEQLSVVDLINSISDEKIDAVIIDYWCNPFSQISLYKDALKGTIKYLKNTWIEYWSEWDPDPLERIDLISRFQNTTDFFNNVTNNSIKIYFAVLPSYMHRLVKDKKINENKNIGFFLVVAGWEDFKTLGKLKNAFDIPRNSQIDFDNIQPEFSHPVNFQNPILKESK